MWLFSSSTTDHAHTELHQDDVSDGYKTPILAYADEETDDGDHHNAKGHLEHISVGTPSSEHAHDHNAPRKWKREYVLPIIAFLIAAFTFVSCFVWIPRSPSVSVKRTTVIFTENTFVVQQTYSISNRNVYRQRIKNFVPEMKFISSTSHRIVTSTGTVCTNYTNVDVSDFTIDKTRSRTIVMDYTFLLTPNEADDASSRCYNPNQGIYLTTTGSMEMQTFGKNFDEINIGMIPSLLHCLSE